MIKVLIFIIGLLIIWQLIRMARATGTNVASLEDARTVGLQEAAAHIQSPVLLEDYAKARGIPKEKLESMIEQEAIPFYQWCQYTYIENRELIDINK